ncbi:MAG: hypothetical protein AAFQ82_22690 [Myxococcota bacterium]
MMNFRTLAPVFLSVGVFVAGGCAGPTAPIVAQPPPPWTPEMFVLERSFDIDRYCASSALELGHVGGRCIQTPEVTFELFQRPSAPPWTQRSAWVDLQGRRFAVGSALPEHDGLQTMRQAVKRAFGHLMRPPSSSRSGLTNEFSVARAIDFYVAPDGTSYVLLVQR